MNGILRTGQLWRSVLGPKVITSRFFADHSGTQRPKNTSKVLSAAAKGVAGVSKDRITLHGVDGASVSITSLDEAQKIAKRRGLRLVKESDFDGKSQRPVYK